MRDRPGAVDAEDRIRSPQPFQLILPGNARDGRSGHARTIPTARETPAGGDRGAGARYWRAGQGRIDGRDLANVIVLAARSDLPGHEVCYVVAPDLPVRRDLAAEARRLFGGEVTLRPVDRPDASGTSARRLRQLLGFVAQHSWREYLDAQELRYPQ